MRYTFAIIVIFASFATTKAQEAETFILHNAISKYDTLVYKRLIRFDNHDRLYHVSDYFENGQIQMEATYRSFDKHVKEEYQCNYRSNTKEGLYKQFYLDGQPEYTGFYHNGLREGISTTWYRGGQKEAEEHWSKGQLHGSVKYWTRDGDLQFESGFCHGINQHPQNVTYKYLTYLPDNYATDSRRKWPLIIYLHGGTARGTDLNKLYTSGIPDQIYRGRSFPFIIISPQCPEHLRWSTGNWFESFYETIKKKYNIDTSRVYLTGASLGGSGTWYLAVKYQGLFAAIAPMCGFTSDNDFTMKNISRLIEMPIWAFHGRIDQTVPFDETERFVKILERNNKNLRFTIEPNVGHWIQWLVYPNQELYDWFLKYHK